MAGISIILDLLTKNTNFNTQTLHSYTLLSASLAASTAAASVPAGSPFPSRPLFRFGAKSVAHCDAGVALPGDFITGIQTANRNIYEYDSSDAFAKVYKIEIKPLFSAFHWKTFTLTSLRSFLLFFLPLLEPKPNLDEDDDDDGFSPNATEDNHVDLVVPFKKSAKQIIRETTVVTTRRLLERVAVYYASPRMACKLLKDVPKSAIRKAGRRMPTLVYLFSVSRTTFRGHCLGVAASWVVQVVIDIYRFVSSIYKSKKESINIDKAEQARILGKRVCGVTIRCGAALVFASVGAGIGSKLFSPSTGQWIGCAIGDLAGPTVVTFCFENFLHVDL